MRETLALRSFFVLVLLSVAVIIPIAVGGVQTQTKVICLWVGLSLLAFVTISVTVMLWFKPSHIWPDFTENNAGDHVIVIGHVTVIGHLEKIVDIPYSALEKVRSDFISEGAIVAVVPQCDRGYTIEALFIREGRPAACKPF